MLSVVVCRVAASFQDFGGPVQSVYKVGRATSQTSASSGARETWQQTLKLASGRAAVFRLFTVFSWWPAPVVTEARTPSLQTTPALLSSREAAQVQKENAPV
jgi:hypothetical protein